MTFSLQRRFSLFVLLPVGLILAVTGIGSFLYASYYLVDQWRSTSVLRLEKTAHQIQMRLDDKLRLINLIAGADEIRNGDVTQAYLIQQLRTQKGVRFVDIEPAMGSRRGLRSKKNDSHVNAAQNPNGLVCLVYNGERKPYYSDPIGFDERPVNSQFRCSTESGSCSIKTKALGTKGTLTIIKRFGGNGSSPAKRLVVSVDFQSLMDNLLEEGRWQGSSAYLVSSDGNYLAGTTHSECLVGKKLGESGSPLEKRALNEIKAKDFGTLVGDNCSPDIVAGFYRIPNTDWYLVLFSWGHVVLAPILRFQWHFLIAGILTLALCLLLIRQGAKSVVRRIGMVSDAAERVERGDYSVVLDDPSSDEIGRFSRRFNSMVEGLKQRDFIQQTFGRYVDKNFVEQLMSKPEGMNLGGQNRVVTILMADIRGFTEMAEKLPPQKVTRMLNRYFSRVIPVIEKYEGIIVDFVGDSVLAFFNGLDREVSDRAYDAAKCAAEILAAVDQTSEENLGLGLPQISVGIGIHTGEVVVGNIGSETRAKYGIVGSAVNETQRIQSHANGGTILISEGTRRAIGDRLESIRSTKTTFKGLNGPRVLFELRSADVADEPFRDRNSARSLATAGQIEDEFSDVSANEGDNLRVVHPSTTGNNPVNLDKVAVGEGGS
ncbi:adenylate/guanylate cyclase domain-containing protein [Thermodesulfobacteriota bacterium]